MKVVIATAVYYPMINGVAVFSHNLAVGLAKRGHGVMVICPSQKKRGYTEVVDGVKVVHLHSTNVRVYPDQIHETKKKFWYKDGFKVSVFPGRAIFRALNKFSPDVVHVQVSDPIGLSVVSYARKHNIPVVTTEHNQPEVLTEPLGMPEFIRKPVNTLLSAYFVNRQSKSDFVTMPTEQAISNLIWSRGKEFKVPVAAVSNGVDLSSFKPGRADKEIYEKYDIPSGVPVVLYVGRVDPEKNVGVALEAFAKFLSRNKVDRLSKTLFVVVGDGVDRMRLIKEAERLGVSDSVRFLGRVLPPDLYELYKVGDVFLTASEIETQGIVLIEAAASGLPLIAVNKGAVSEVCRDGVNGVLCKPKDVDGISKALDLILGDEKLQKKYAKKSIEIASEHDFERTLDRFINIYNKVVNSKE